VVHATQAQKCLNRLGDNGCSKGRVIEVTNIGTLLSDQAFTFNRLDCRNEGKSINLYFSDDTSFESFRDLEEPYQIMN